MSSISIQSDPIREKASRYVVRLHSGELSESEEIEISQWCSQSPRHRQEFDTLLSVWDECGALIDNRSPPSQVRHPFKALPYVAALCIASFLALLPANTKSPVTSEVTANKTFIDVYQTAIGEVSKITLEDGTLVTLNTDTAIKVDFSDAIRHVALLRGEVFFDVAKNKQRPFLIDTGIKTIRVVGTRFNVKKAENQVDVAVKEGVVAIQEPLEQPGSSTPDNQQLKEPVLLKAGTYASFNPNYHLVADNRPDQVEEAQSWRSGTFRFKDERLDKVIATFNRYRKQPIELADEQVASYRISGLFRLSDGDSVLNALESTLPLKIHRHGDKIVLISQ